MLTANQAVLASRSGFRPTDYRNPWPYSSAVMMGKVRWGDRFAARLADSYAGFDWQDPVYVLKHMTTYPEPLDPLRVRY